MIIYFTASWCGPCKMFRPVLEEVQRAVGANVTIVDVDANGQLAMQHGVTSVPTILVVKDGDVKYRHSGVLPKTQLVEVLTKYKN